MGNATLNAGGVFSYLYCFTAEERRNNLPMQNVGDVVFAKPRTADDDGMMYSIVDISGNNGEYGKGVYLDTDIF